MREKKAILECYRLAGHKETKQTPPFSMYLQIWSSSAMLQPKASHSIPVQTPWAINPRVRCEYGVGCTRILYSLELPKWLQNGLKTAWGNQFLLNCSKEGFCTGIVVAVSLGTHALENTVFPKQVLEVIWCVLRTPVWVKNYTFWRTLIDDCHIYSINDKLLCHTIR